MTWDHPLEKYFCDHLKSNGIDGSVVLTVVDKNSIPMTELCNGELYTLMLRDHMREKFIANGDKRIRGFPSQGILDGNISEAYMVYMDYKFEVGPFKSLVSYLSLDQ